ncbi:hypothetical protein [Streptomyces sp. NRRL S-1022]|uniref:hypothetical protein n=1 Tax=Streptomyces sp. NRRL S-1022 TaxID=1463880 RepID=UPI00131B9A2D|nr:hypothetical protein [Streptomyces sp. NRRL S-1022]
MEQVGQRRREDGDIAQKDVRGLAAARRALTRFAPGHRRAIPDDQELRAAIAAVLVLP